MPVIPIPPVKGKTRRVQLELAERSMERLERLKEKTEASSYAEVVKNALRLYEAMVNGMECIPVPGGDTKRSTIQK